MGVGGFGTFPMAGAGATLEVLELTKNGTANPESATPTALGGGNRISNLTPLTGWDVQELPVETDSDVTSAGSPGANDDNLTYLGLHEHSPKNHDTTLDL